MKRSGRARLRAVAADHGLEQPAVERIARLVRLIAEDEHAPTAVRDPDGAVDVHIADSLAALDVEAVRNAGTIADLGSGAGLPGLPLAIALPDARVFLVESAQRKCSFLARAREVTGASNATVVCARVEEWEEGRGLCDVVVARALAPLAVIAEYAAPLLALGGSLVAWKGRRDAEEEHQGAAAAEELGLRVEEVRPVRPYPASRDRHLHVLVKERRTPERFPRAPGRARKRPLGA